MAEVGAMSLKIVLTALFFFSYLAFAEETPSGQWTKPGELTNKFYNYHYDGVLVLHSQSINPQKCIKHSKKGWVLLPFDSQFKDNYHVVSTAIGKGKKLQLYIDGCDSTGSYPVVRSVALKL